MTEEVKKPEPEVEMRPEVVNEPATEKLDAEEIEKAVMGEHIPAGEEAAQAEAEQKEDDIDGGALCSTLYVIVFSQIATRRGKHWELESGEAAELGGATDAVITKYFGKIKAGPEVMLMMAVTGVLMSRVLQDKAIAAEKKKAQHDGRDTG